MWPDTCYSDRFKINIIRPSNINNSVHVRSVFRSITVGGILVSSKDLTDTLKRTRPKFISITSFSLAIFI